ncbi:hypothetical protein AWH56_020520 [Anaerobacillus isosaccharinicus]|uniref:Uncharacterized protein n=1 Tax=Anaerobacillus isosaccharinicus TaxID=1532552 RepID=A0A7S7L636_9BACI|nr:hypothetical protein [Anaerobacillus isosaccharinicus]MBA5586708.1 hypothetical protein [Anaerobacillus isosaccharinicus]QOY35067.1 hypothetical protein AWH56_020520 [Anaerobacillus isosaccharinicus]
MSILLVKTSAYRWKLFSSEVENEVVELRSKLNEDLSKEIDEYPELKASLLRYLDNSDMKRYSGSELKSKRYGQRK